MGIHWKQGLFSAWALLSLVWIVVALVMIYQSTSALIFTAPDQEYICAAHLPSSAESYNPKPKKELGSLELSLLSKRLKCERDDILIIENVRGDIRNEGQWWIFSHGNLYRLFLFLLFPTLIIPAAALATLAIFECIRNGLYGADE